MHCFSDFNKGGDPIWYYNSQALKPAVQEKFKEMQIIPFDNPPWKWIASIHHLNDSEPGIISWILS